MFPEGMVPGLGVIPPQPIPTNVRCDKVDVDGDPAARVTVYSLTGIHTFFIPKSVCKEFAITLAEIGDMESTPKLYAPSAADIIQLGQQRPKN
jgi:hypothetical protein